MNFTKTTEQASKYEHLEKMSVTNLLTNINNEDKTVPLAVEKSLPQIEKQGITGSKIEYKSITYKSISRFSVETAGTFDLEAELKIWVSSEAHPSIVKQFNKSVNVYDVQNVLAHHVLK